jgi:peroxiredoxin
LADFQQHNAELHEHDTRVVALSADSADEARGTMEQLGLDFSVAYGLDALAVSRAIGCYTGTRKGQPHLQPAAFVLAPDGTIVHAAYSSGKVGRFTADDALVVVKDLRQAQREKERAQTAGG